MYTLYYLARPITDVSLDDFLERWKLVIAQFKETQEMQQSQHQEKQAGRQEEKQKAEAPKYQSIRFEKKRELSDLQFSRHGNNKRGRTSQ